MHRETRDIEVYRLVMAREDGRPGPALRRSTYDCAGLPLAPGRCGQTWASALNPNTPDRLVCGMRVGIGRIQFGGRPLSFLTNTLTAMTERRVVEATGMTGDWEFDISFSPPAASTGCRHSRENLNAASLFTVLQEQLGLKLQSSRMPMPVMGIDRVERPVDD